MTSIFLKKGREKALLRHHPWIFSGAIAKASVPFSEIRPGEAVEVLSEKGEFLGQGFYSPASELRVRIVSWTRENALDGDFLKKAVTKAVESRKNLFPEGARNALRLVHGESDGLPGLIVDLYDNVLSVQILSVGFEMLRKELVSALFDAVPQAVAIYERSDAAARTREGLEPRTGVLALRPNSPTPDFSKLTISLNGIKMLVDIENGQKTGSYLDQAENHALVGSYASGKDVLDAFSYDGGFTLAALKNGAASVTAIDSSEAAISSLQDNLERNGFARDSVECLCTSVFTQLRAFRDARRSFDLIILDPPKFADSKGHVEKACRAYKDINLLAFKLLRPGGILATFSCSGAIDPALFQKVIAESASDAKCEARILQTFLQAPDHPVLLSFPESLYLKGLLVIRPGTRGGDSPTA